MKLHIDPLVRPISQPQRRVPYHLHRAVEAEVTRLLENDFIEKAVDPTPWISPIHMTPKKDEWRMVVDIRLTNKSIQRECHVMPTMGDIISDVASTRFFSNIDLVSAYHQVELALVSRYITSFSTHVGLFRYKRPLFSVSAVAEVFHNLIRDTLKDIPGVVNLSDDVLIVGRTREEQDHKYAMVRSELQDKGLMTNEKKGKIRQTQVKFAGIIIGAHGVEINPPQAVLDAGRPKSMSDVRSLLGLTKYCSRFFLRRADLSASLRQLMSSKEFVWSEECERAFQNLKSATSNPRKLSDFRPN